MERVVAGGSSCSSLTSGLGLSWFLPAPFLQCDPALTPGGSGVLADPARIDEEFRKAWLPYSCRSGQRETHLAEFAHEDEGSLNVLLEDFFAAAYR